MVWDSFQSPSFLRRDQVSFIRSLTIIQPWPPHSFIIGGYISWKYKHASNLGANVTDVQHLPCLHDSLQTVRSHNLLRYSEQLHHHDEQGPLRHWDQHVGWVPGQYVQGVQPPIPTLKVVFTPCKVGRLREHHSTSTFTIRMELNGKTIQPTNV